MKLWVITCFTVAAAGAAYHFWVAGDSLEHFMAGYLFGAPLGGLFLRVMLHKWLKPEFFEEHPKKEAVTQ